MAKAYSYMPINDRMVLWVEQRIYELSETINDANSEREMWNAWIVEWRKHNCLTCGGHRLIRDFDGQDNVLVSCPGCGGTGKQSALTVGYGQPSESKEKVDG